MAAERVSHRWHRLSRRRFLTHSTALLTALQLQRAAHALGLGANVAVCPLIAEQEEGPYYVAGESIRSDIREGRPGIPLKLNLAILDIRTCKPLAHAAVDIWHCDAMGIYSGYTKQSMMGPGGTNGGPPPDFDPQSAGPLNGPPDGMPPPGPGFEPMGPPPAHHPSDKLTFLRGIQMTDNQGRVEFQTIFPGFYMGRTNHIHFKVRVDGKAEGKSYAAGHTSHTGQIFFPEDLALTLMENAPYKAHAIHRTTQEEDAVFNDQHGSVAIARVARAKADDPEAGWHAEMVAGVDPSATPQPARRGGPGMNERRPGDPSAS